MTARENSALRHVTHWLADLVNLMPPIADAKNRIATMASVIATELPNEAFTPESLRVVAAKCTFFPAYSELHAALSAWWDEHKPRPVFDLPSVDDPTLDGAARAYAKAWLTNRAKNFEHLRHVGDLDARMAIALDVIRLHSDAAFAYITRTDAEAQRIGLQRGWLRDASDRPEARTDEQRAAVHESAQAAIRALRAANMPPGATVTTRPVVQEPRKNREPTEEELTAYRKVAGIREDKPPTIEGRAEPPPPEPANDRHLTQRLPDDFFSKALEE